MKAIRLIKPFTFEFINLEKPIPKENELLVKVLKVGICGSDVSKFTGEHIRVPFPCEIGFPGHEAVGVVEGSKSKSFKQGDLVLIEKGNSFKEYVTQNEENFLLLPIPNNQYTNPHQPIPNPQSPTPNPLDEFVCSQPLGTVVRCFHKLNQLEGKNVVVLGQGQTGLLFNSMFRMRGAKKIVGVDVLDYRLEVSKKMGATHIFNNNTGDLEEFVEDMTNGEMADVVVEAIGYQETYQQAFRIVRKGGRVVFFGMIRDLDEGKFFKLNFDDVFRKEITIIPSYGPHLIKDIKVAMELIGDGKIDVKPLITHHFKFNEVVRAFEIAYSKETNPIKVIVDF